MPFLYIYVLIVGVGALSAALLVGRYVPSVRSLSRDDQRKWLMRLPPFFDFVSEAWQNRITPPLMRFWNAHVHPLFMGEGEKWSRRFRLVALRIERMFHRLSDYFRGKRMAMQANGGASVESAQGKNSQFWNDIQRLKSSGNKKPE